MARSSTRGEHHYVLSEFRTIEHSLCSARAAADSLSSHKLNFPFVCFQHMIWLTLCIHNSLHLINIVQLLSGSGFLTAPKCLQCVSGEKNKPLIINRYLAIKDEMRKEITFPHSPNHFFDLLPERTVNVNRRTNYVTSFVKCNH